MKRLSTWWVVFVFWLLEIRELLLMRKRGESQVSQGTKRKRSSTKVKRTKEEEQFLLIEQQKNLSDLIESHIYKDEIQIVSPSSYEGQVSINIIQLKSREEIEQQIARKILYVLGQKKYQQILKKVSRISRAIQVLLSEQLQLLFRWNSSKSTYKIKSIDRLVKLLEGKRKEEFIKQIAKWVSKLKQDREEWDKIEKEVVQEAFQAKRLGMIAVSFIQLVKFMMMLGKSDQKQLKSHEGTLITEFLQLHQIYRDNFTLMLNKTLKYSQYEQILLENEKDKKDSIKNLVKSEVTIYELIEMFKATLKNERGVQKSNHMKLAFTHFSRAPEAKNLLSSSQNNKQINCKEMDTCINQAKMESAEFYSLSFMDLQQNYEEIDFRENDTSLNCSMEIYGQEELLYYSLWDYLLEAEQNNEEINLKQTTYMNQTKKQASSPWAIFNFNENEQNEQSFCFQPKMKNQFEGLLEQDIDQFREQQIPQIVRQCIKNESQEQQNQHSLAIIFELVSNIRQPPRSNDNSSH